MRLQERHYETLLHLVNGVVFRSQTCTKNNRIDILDELCHIGYARRARDDIFGVEMCQYHLTKLGRDVGKLLKKQGYLRHYQTRPIESA